MRSAITDTDIFRTEDGWATVSTLLMVVSASIKLKAICARGALTLHLDGAVSCSYVRKGGTPIRQQSTTLLSSVIKLIVSSFGRMRSVAERSTRAKSSVTAKMINSVCSLYAVKMPIHQLIDL